MSKPASVARQMSRGEQREAQKHREPDVRSAFLAARGFIVTGLLLSTFSTVMAQDQAEPAGELTPEMQAAMKAMTPGEAHQQLAKLEGEWTYISKLTAPGMPAEETTGTSNISLVMGGRFLHEQSEGTMMGSPYQSAKLMGYNNGSKKYEAVWTYTMGTNMMTMSGTSKDGGHTIIMDAQWDNEIGLRETITVTYHIVDNDRFAVTMGGGKMPDGSPGPEMEMSYTRKN